MHNVKHIRTQILNVTQQELAEGIGCTQGNVNQYEHGQGLPAVRAYKLIEYAKSLGVSLTLDQIYRAPETSEAGEAA